MRTYRRVLHTALAALAAAAALLLLPQPAHAQQSDEHLRFAFVHSGKCLDLLGFRVANGAEVGQWSCNGNTNQLWIVRPVGFDNLHEVRAFHSDKCLDALGFRTANGSPIGQWDCNGETNQQWRIIRRTPVPGGPTEVTFVNRFSGKCLDMQGFALGNGAKAVQWDCNDKTNQRLNITF